MAWFFWNQYFRNSDLFPGHSPFSSSSRLFAWRGSAAWLLWSPQLCPKTGDHSLYESQPMRKSLPARDNSKGENTSHRITWSKTQKKTKYDVWVKIRSLMVDLFFQRITFCVFLVISDFPPSILEAILSHELITERRRIHKEEGSHHRFFGAHWVSGSGQILSHWILTVYFQTRIILILKKRKFK